MPVVHIKSDDEFLATTAIAKDKPVIIDFFADWCGPCRAIAPFFEQLSNQYNKCLFLKVKTDDCDGTAARFAIRSLPTFVVSLNGKEMERMSGANQGGLEQLVKKYSEMVGATLSDSSSGSGAMDLTSLIMKSQCECLNNDDDHPLENCLVDDNRELRSDADAQLIISLAFNQVVKLSGVQIWAAGEFGPKQIKVFANIVNAMDFDAAEKMTATQELLFEAKDLNGALKELKFVKFQNIQNLHIFVKDNQSGDDDVTRIRRLVLRGTPKQTTDMSNLKKTGGE